MKNILVTGGAGFIGSNFIRYMIDRYPICRFINVDSLTYAGNLNNLASVSLKSNYIFIKCDICDRKQIETVFNEWEIDTVVNFAAESHVDRSIIDPETFVTTNILGTQILLDVAKKKWKIFPNDKYSVEYKSNVKFLQVSTDEVYGALGAEGLFVESMPLLPNSPYSASKASADLIVRSYHNTFGLPTLISRCSNNYGPFQFPEKLMPLIINNCLTNIKIPVYGDGKQIRDWLYVEDHCSAIEAILNNGRTGEIYNVGGNNEKANIEIIKSIIHILGKDNSLIQFVPDRPGHDKRYAIDNTKITSELEWVPKYSFEEGLKKTVNWYLENTDWIKNIISGEYQNYYNDMYE